MSFLTVPAGSAVSLRFALEPRLPAPSPVLPPFILELHPSGHGVRGLFASHPGAVIASAVWGVAFVFKISERVTL